MAADMKNLPKNNSSLAFTPWLNKMKKAQTQGDEPERAVMQKKMAKKVMTVESNYSSEKIMAENNKNNNNEGGYRTSKKTCICAPTNHAGSFRCQHHRIKMSPQDRADKKSKCENFNSKAKTKTTVPANNGDSQPRLSRFGRAAACKNLPLTMPSSKPEKVK